MNTVIAVTFGIVLYLTMKALTRPQVTLAVSGARLQELAGAQRAKDLGRRRAAQVRAAHAAEYAPELTPEDKGRVALHLALVKGVPDLDEAEAERLRGELLERRLIAADQLREAA